MNKAILFIAVVYFFFSCQQQPVYEPAQDSMEAGRQFIDGCLKGEFKRANFYMVQDATNKDELQRMQSAYDRKDADYRVQYRQASILIDHEEAVNDSVRVIYYKNSFDKEPRKVKVVQRSDQWLVDLKYTFDGNL
ncbi:MAG: hypothetical protein QM610_12405 [Chitinophagaceae bacterium]